MKQLLFYIGIVCIMISCGGKTFDSEAAMWTYLKDPENQYIQTKEVNGVSFSLLYKPTDLLVAQELTEDKNQQQIDSLRKKYGEYLYFNLSMSRGNQELLTGMAGNRQQFGSMVNQLAFGMEEKVHMYTPHKDTIAMADYIYPRMYGMSGATTMLLVYPREEKIEKDTYINLTIEDLGLYTGEVKFKIPIKVITNEPQLQF